MSLKNSSFKRMFFVLLVMGTAGCGMYNYPGQPGVRTNDFSKLDMEDLEDDGLYVYEASYDNTAKTGKGVGALITRRYPTALTYTSNARVNSEGTLYRAKLEYQGSRIEMISIPSINQVMMPPDSTVWGWLYYDTSMDEIDDRNMNEEGIFVTQDPEKLLERGIKNIKQKYDLIRLGKLDLVRGQLSYDIKAVKFAGTTYKPAANIGISTNLSLSSIHSNVSLDTKKSFASFLETNFPKGFKGKLSLVLADGTEYEVNTMIGVHTAKTAKNAGMNVIIKTTRELEEIASRYSTVK